MPKVSDVEGSISPSGPTNILKKIVFYLLFYVSVQDFIRIFFASKFKATYEAASSCTATFANYLDFLKA